jgi:hypothetical protein
MLINNLPMHPVVYAQKISITFDAAILDAELRLRIERFLMDLTRRLKNDGCELIGHIKGLFAADSAGYLMFSITSPDEPPKFKGEINSKITGAQMSVNVIVYGVGLKIVETAFEKASRSLCLT